MFIDILTDTVKDAHSYILLQLGGVSEEEAVKRPELRSADDLLRFENKT